MERLDRSRKASACQGHGRPSVVENKVLASTRQELQAGRRKPAGERWGTRGQSRIMTEDLLAMISERPPPAQPTAFLSSACVCVSLVCSRTRLLHSPPCSLPTGRPLLVDAGRLLWTPTALSSNRNNHVVDLIAFTLQLRPTLPLFLFSLLSSRLSHSLSSHSLLSPSILFDFSMSRFSRF